jgi:hypothetical protein
VIVPGASPFIITGLRQAFLRAWIAVIGAEFLAAFDWGLGWVIFDARELLNTDVVLASLLVIGAIGFIFERLVFGSLERTTVLRLGMVRVAKTQESEKLKFRVELIWKDEGEENTSMFLTSDGRVILQGRAVTAQEKKELSLPQEGEMISVDKKLIRAIKDML